MSKRRLAALVGVLFLLGSGVRLARYQRWPGECVGNGRNEILRIAESLRLRGVFADPYAIPTGPTAHHAPVFPILLAEVQSLPALEGMPAQVLLNIVLGSALCASVPIAAAALGMRPLTGLAAALMLAVLPPSLAVELCNDQEATLVGLLAVWAVICGTAWLRGRAIPAAVLGLSWGFILLAAPALAPVCVGFLLLGARAGRSRRQTAILVALTVVALMPWIVRNRIMIGAWVPVRSNFGLELRVSNADEARMGATDNAVNGAMRLYHPLFNVSIAEAVAKDGEANVYAQMRRDAFAWIAGHPRRFLELTVERTWRFWFPERVRTRDVVYLWVSLLAAVAGVALLFREGRLAAGGVLCVVLLYPLIFYFLQSYERYRYPIDWLIVLCAAHAALWRLTKVHRWFERLACRV